MSVFSVFRGAWQNRAKLGDQHQARELAAFLPAALEIQSAPPNPLVRWLAWSLLLLLTLAITWAILGHVNIVASAEGKIIPSSRVKQVQPLEKGVVRAVLVAEGDYVEKGQALVELESTLTRADKARLQAELNNIIAKCAVNEQLLRYLGSMLDNTVKSAAATSTLPLLTWDKTHVLAEQQNIFQQLLNQRWQQYYSQAQALKSALERTAAEQASTQAMISKLEKTLPIVEKRVKNLSQLKGQQFVSEDEYLVREQERIQQAHDLIAEKQRLQQLKASESELYAQLSLHTAQTRSELLSEMTDLHTQQAGIKEELIKAADMNAKRVLYAPVSGRVQELVINTVGGVVTDAQQLMLVVPDEEQLEVEVTLDNKDIGFVHESLPAEIKIHTFPFTKYGVIKAEVTHVSDDAILDEQRGLIYGMHLRLAKNTLRVNGKEVKLIPGMTVTAEVQTGKRRIIEFFLAPLLRAKSESIRER